MKNGGGHFAPKLGGQFELESGGHFKLELGGQYHWNLQLCKLKTKREGKQSDVTLVSNLYNGYRFGLTFHSFGFTEDINYQKERWVNHCVLRKYMSKSSLWIGLASYPEGSNPIDLAMYYNEPWEYDVNQEEILKHSSLKLYPSLNKAYKKVGRNELCPCDSGKKYKKCCMIYGA